MTHTARQSFAVFETEIPSKSSSDAIDALLGLKSASDYLASSHGKEWVYMLLKRLRLRKHSQIRIRVSLDVLYQEEADATNTAVLSPTLMSEEYY
jgi:hypothetical protein